ncbi:dsDNA nuclease domain-containing protein [Photobacterium damselae]|uniref:CD-NTase associated protein 4-like DNA endonuclease domain-containing protein n=2 Tax=Photobacterium damselae TaxID=38293 RepID=D0YWZ2_PHODD|nr:dsDNA nuclease domain-containing protein [Photobacterium damselae]EEZ41013.1 hypothetical protein VDA_002045 [Photobacterium damselae subsp. damselae CIP 102761]PSW83586.1 DUF4297 domain-containing protein [Photobacterium damselae]SPY28290.1 Uncharacterised protein [Photobacterium damselae]
MHIVTDINLKPNFAQADKQDEDAGALTFAKYWYQYNWALLHLFNQMPNFNNCSITMETHEDVMFISNIDYNETKIDLFQVKERSKSGNITSNVICRGSKDKPAIISKIIKNITKERLVKRLNSIALVSSTDYSFKLKNEDDKISSYHSVNFNHLSDEVKNEIKKAVLRDLDISEIPNFLYFIRGMQTTSKDESTLLIIGIIAKYIDSIDPNSSSKPKLIYDAITTELLKIGCSTLKYNNWDDFVKNKTITKKQIEKIIQRRTTREGFTDFESVWIKITNEMSNDANYAKLPIKSKSKMKKKVREYYGLKMTQTNLMFDSFSEKVNELFELSSKEDLYEIIIDIKSNLLKDEKYSDIFNEELLEPAILLEISENI